ncbi:MAG: hypothetical protein COA73_11460 [Candidatus Hydrogenedentota bacterium]|nr:MAG: hypothetical protein COA73_11460 [Candidatus Hydrogenedentota bacterium]
MNRRVFTKVIAMFVAGISAFGQTATAEKILKDSWEAWKNGDIPLTKLRAEEHLRNNHEVDEARHLLFLTSYVTGDYEGALAYYDAIDTSYGGLRELDEIVVEAYLHLLRISEALDFVRSRKGTPDWMENALERHVARPLKTSLETLSVVPFADHPLTEYFPAFTVEINGQTTIAHVDTGGSFLYMGPERAKKLGIQTFQGPSVAAHLDLRRVNSALGIVDRFVLGEAVLQNVPITVLPSLTGEQDVIIFGTSILQQFLATLDYPQQRLILSPRGKTSATQEHFQMQPSSQVRMPFYMWSDHYMFARGSLGPYTDLNFFVDSGLVLVYPDNEGQARQVGFTTSKKKFLEWDIPRKMVRKDHFESPYSLRLGTLEQEGHIMVTGKAGDNNFGGIRIDGLISHGFLKQYAWTIDFDKREYVFSSE